MTLGALAASACGGDDSTGNGTGNNNNNNNNNNNADGGGVTPGTDGGVGPGQPPPPPPNTNLTACMPGTGKDYQVGPGSGQIASLDLVPWESLAAGDTVRIFYKSTPYAGKFMIAASGTAAAPVRVCGVKGPNGERPIIDGANATTRKQLLPFYGNKASDQVIHQGRNVILVKHNGSGPYMAYPSYIQIDGLAVRRAHPSYTFTDAAGATMQKYDSFGACIWIERGHNITIADNELSDCSQGLNSRSTDEGDFAVTKDIRVVGNSIFNNGIVGDEHEHNSYMESQGIVYEFNHYGAVRQGAGGNAIKDRSAGTVIRYNRIDDGAHAFDLVEAEDFPGTATKDPAYRTTFVYGNQISKRDNGSFIHYGGDHYGSTPGSNWGEPIFRKGTLYFFYNTVIMNPGGSVFQVSTTDEHAEIWDNVIFATGGMVQMRQGTDGIGSTWTAGGIVNLGRNWVSAGWKDADQYHPIPGMLNGASNLLTGSSAPVNLMTFAPVAGSAIIGAAQPGPSTADMYKAQFELDGMVTPQQRKTTADLGAVEH
jgi:hypothetical protein